MSEGIGTKTVLKRFVLWLTLCSISAAPSFVIALGADADRVGMLAGVLLFAFAYTMLTCTARFERLYQKPFIRSTMYVGYAVRMVLSVSAIGAAIAPPLGIGMGIDMICGMLAMGIGGALLGSNAEQAVSTFGGALLVTCIQGAILNVIVFVFMLIVYALQRAFRKPPIEPRGFEVVPMATVAPVDREATPNS